MFSSRQLLLCWLCIQLFGGHAWGVEKNAEIVHSEVHSLIEYGGIPDCSSVACAMQNGISFRKAVLSSRRGDTVLFEPEMTFHFIPSRRGVIEDVSGVTILVEGRVALHDNYRAWPTDSDGNYFNAFDFRRSSDLIVTGDGRIDGQGEVWWRAFLLGFVVRQRPTMVYFEDCKNTLFERVTLWNAPRFNIYGSNVDRFVVRNATIWVDVDLQLNISHELTDQYAATFFDSPNINMVPRQLSSIPIFPYNTDGVDFHGKDIHLYDLTISNFDDAVAVKSSHSNMSINCTVNVLVERIHVLYGVGLSIGSVPPNRHNRCVRNVTFQNIEATDPIKLVYIK